MAGDTLFILSIIRLSATVKFV